MSPKHVMFRGEAREKLLRGASALADAIRVTLGPRSKSVLIDKKYGRPLVCNDGVTIAREMELKDPEENLGARMVREAAERTGDAVGDGTSTATVLAHAIYADGLRNVAAGASAIDLKRGLDRAVLVAIEAVKACARPVDNRREMAQVATISEYDKEQLNQRLAKLARGVAVIRVGAPSEAEMKSRKEALDDAISATKAAVAEGIVPGGGLTLLRAMDALEQEEAKCDGDERTGVRILKRALEVPARQIAENSAAEGGVVVGQMRAGKGNVGFDASTGKFVDLMEAGIIDPVKVVRLGLENAVSVAGLLLLTEATMTDLPEPAREARQIPGGDFGNE